MCDLIDGRFYCELHCLISKIQHATMLLQAPLF